MSLLRQIFGGSRQRDALDPLYRALVERGRDPFWYRDGAVPDTLDGRFDMLAALIGLALLRLEADGPAAREPTRLLTEIFVDDMEGTLRQIGIGDYVVSKHVGRMMGALGGRIGAFRAADAEGTDYDAAVRRNIFHESPPSDDTVRRVAARLEGFARALRETATADLVAGRLPAL